MPPHAFIRRNPSSTTGMSLLEVILAIAVAGSVLAAAVSLLVSISTIWTNRAERHFFIDHVDGVTEFLNATFATAAVEITSSDNTHPQVAEHDPADGTADADQPDSSETHAHGSLMRSVAVPVDWARPPGFADYQEPLLHVKLTDTPPILVGLENAPLRGIDAFLYFQADEGLSLLWHSILQEQVEDISDLRRTLLSPLVSDIQYLYWDERIEKWELSTQPKQGDGEDSHTLPRYIKLTFSYAGEIQERILTLPVPSQSALIF